MQVLIIGSGTREYILARYLSKNTDIETIYAIPGNDRISEFAQCYEVNKLNSDDVVCFAQEHDIGLTITFDEEVIASGMVNKFNEAALSIFAPTKEATRIAVSKAVGKKFMYKTKIRTPKFAVIDKESTGVEYLKNANYPVVIKSDNMLSVERPVVCRSFPQAKRILELKYLVENCKVVIEDFIEGKCSTVYFATDGYNALPLLSSVPYKYSLEGGGGLITSGLGAYAPAQNIDSEKIIEIQQSIIYPALREMAKNDNPFIGIIGAEVIITPYDEMFTLDFKISPDALDANLIFTLLDEDFIRIANAAIVGSLADDYDEIRMKDSSVVSAVLCSPNYWKTNIKNSVISGIEEAQDEVDVIFDEVCRNKYLEYETCGVNNLIVSAESSTIGGARKKLYENIEKIDYFDKKYLKDIAQMRTVQWV